jgi:hypothetical protein
MEETVKTVKTADLLDIAPGPSVALAGPTVDGWRSAGGLEIQDLNGLTLRCARVTSSPEKYRLASDEMRRFGSCCCED